MTWYQVPVQGSTDSLADDRPVVPLSKDYAFQDDLVKYLGGNWEHIKKKTGPLLFATADTGTNKSECFQRKIAKDYGEMFKIPNYPSIPIVGLDSATTERLYAKDVFYDWMSKKSAFVNMIPKVYAPIEATELQEAKLDAIIAKLKTYTLPIILKPVDGCCGNLKFPGQDNANKTYPIIKKEDFVDVPDLGGPTLPIRNALKKFSKQYPGKRAVVSEYITGGEEYTLYFVFDKEQKRFLHHAGVRNQLDAVGFEEFRGVKFEADRAVLDKIQNLLGAIGMKGIGCVNYKFADAAGKDPETVRIFEINPRICGGLEKDISTEEWRAWQRSWLELYTRPAHWCSDSTLLVTILVVLLVIVPVLVLVLYYFVCRKKEEEARDSEEDRLEREPFAGSMV